MVQTLSHSAACIYLRPITDLRKRNAISYITKLLGGVLAEIDTASRRGNDIAPESSVQGLEEWGGEREDERTRLYSFYVEQGCRGAVTGMVSWDTGS